jgi:hypothetical protein
VYQSHDGRAEFRAVVTKITRDQARRITASRCAPPLRQCSHEDASALVTALIR